MKIGDVLYFSPSLPFSQLNLDTPQTLIEALKSRVEGCYLQPAARSIEAGDAFAGGLVCCAAIEFIAAICEEIEPSDWLRQHIPAFDRDDTANQFWIRFRHGLAHEGYIKNQGQFAVNAPELLMVAGPVMVVNPRLLFEAVQNAFSDYCEGFTASQAARLSRRLHRYFDPEIEAAKS